MGYMVHHAIIVTGWNTEHITEARARALKIFPPAAVSPILQASVNGYETFVVGPDGSKAAWVASNEGDAQRDEFVKLLETMAYPDGSAFLTWAEVQYGDDEDNNYLTRRSVHLGERL